MAAPLRDRLSFLSRLPVLLRGTADDDTPCPGYLFEEIAKISHESPGSSQCLLEHLLTRLQSSSCHVKLKAGAEDPAAHLLAGLAPVCAAAEEERQLHPGGCSVLRAPRPPPRQQLEPEGAGGRTGPGQHSVLGCAAAAAPGAARPAPGPRRDGLQPQPLWLPAGIRLQQ
ncbi:AP-4 complex accessory subunit tepsin [Pyrgilauda ruficollis]|uniref:AP-4 complex accessory subunit tepsin n=1 Tax=Pyrgilauda ruficollis TaxID=221976 RepID=UPI001B8841A1|nr:AP-4 complex accessory subunit tepsin [Pyrgilauda ruficollis]